VAQRPEKAEPMADVATAVAARPPAAVLVIASFRGEGRFEIVRANGASVRVDA
jgi:hypothetical protein